MQSLPETCQDVQAAIPLFVGGDLDAVEQEAVQAHLEDCGTCRAFAASAASARDVFRTLDPGDPPAGTDLWPALRGRLAEEGLLTGAPVCDLAPIHSLSRWRRLAVGSLAAAAALVVTVRLADLGPGTTPTDPGMRVVIDDIEPPAPSNVAGTPDLRPVYVEPGSELRPATDDDPRMVETAVDVIDAMPGLRRDAGNVLTSDGR